MLARPKGVLSSRICQAGYHFLLHPRYDLLQGQVSGVESERIGRRPQRRMAPRAVALVARGDLPGERRLVHGFASTAELVELLA